MDPMEFQEVGVGKDKRFYFAHDVLQTNKQEAPEIKRRQNGSLDCRSQYGQQLNQSSTVTPGHNQHHQPSSYLGSQLQQKLVTSTSVVNARRTLLFYIVKQQRQQQQHQPKQDWLLLNILVNMW